MSQQEVVVRLAYLRALARSQAALASILESTGSTIRTSRGKLLMEELQEDLIQCAAYQREMMYSLRGRRSRSHKSAPPPPSPWLNRALAVKG
jgi:hypothetical protein